MMGMETSDWNWEWSLKVSSCVVVLVTGLMLYFLDEWPSLCKYLQIQKIPGPKGVFYFGNAYELKDLPHEDFLSWLLAKFEDYPRMMRMWFLGKCHVYLKRPEDIQVILNSKQAMSKGIEYGTICLWLDTGLLTSTGEKWFNRRKLLTPAFHFKILEDNQTAFSRNGWVLSNKLRRHQGQKICFASFITLCTLDVIVETSMGVQLDSQNKSGQDYVKEIKRISELVSYRMVRPQLYKDWIFALSSSGRQFFKTMKFLHDFSYKVIRERSLNFDSQINDINQPSIPEGGKVRRALLDTLLDAEKKQPGTLSEKDMREEVDTFMFEGHDTTSAALIFIFLNLAKYPDIQDKVAREVQEVLGNPGDPEKEVTVADLRRLVYTEMVIKESLRLFPSVPYISRINDEEIVLDNGMVLPKSCNIVILIFLLHRNPDYWPEPEKFNPERFTEEEVCKRHPYAYIPFSAGSRNCIGQKFAMMELKTLVATVIRDLRVELLTNPDDIKFVIHMILRVNKDLYFKFLPR